MRLGLTPLIDVVFLLLLFFMLSSTFLDKRHLTISASPPASAPSGEATAVVVRVDEQSLQVGGRAVSPDQVAAALEAIAGRERDRPILVRPGATVPLQRLVDVLETIDRGGFTNVSLQAID